MNYDYNVFEKKLIAFFITGLIVVSIIAGISVYKDRQYIQKYGNLHCGDVEVKTPSGQKAFERQCWRSKD